MILGGDFYTIAEQLVMEAEKIAAVLKINPEHDIFRGHFPGHPVVPGVCMMQIIKELLETATGNGLRLQNGSDLKFLSVIDPNRNPIVHAEASYTGSGKDHISVIARLYFNDITFFKFKGIFTLQ